MFEGGWSVEEASVDAHEGGVVVVDDGVPELVGLVLGHFHDLVCIAIANIVSLMRMSVVSVKPFV